ncbi:MAG: gliding motility lipoprotein GldD [Bacteroidales bacterium]
MKKLNNLPRLFILASLLLLLTVSCDQEYYPKPMGYFRIDLPEKTYNKFDTTFPYSFEYPSYSIILPDDDPKAEPYWINMFFPGFKGTLHISYKIVDGNLNEYLEDTRTMVMKHIPKASAIENKEFIYGKATVYGLTYSISGVSAASPYQFYLTDSTKNFVRGALYFNVVPNNDSLAPVIDFLKEDINHMIETFKWKENE